MKMIVLSERISYRQKKEIKLKSKSIVHIDKKSTYWYIMKIYAHYGFNDFITALRNKMDYIKQHFLNKNRLLYDFI